MSNIGQESWETFSSEVLIGSILVCKKQDPMWNESPETRLCQMNERTNKRTCDAAKNNSPTPALWQERGQ